MRALEAPKAPPPAAWHETATPQTLAHLPFKSLKQGCCFGLSSIMLYKLSPFGPLLNSRLKAAPMSLIQMKRVYSEGWGSE